MEKTKVQKNQSCSGSERPFFDKQGGDHSQESKNFFESSSVQPSLEVGEPDDPYEKEAEKVSQQVMQQYDVVSSLKPDSGLQSLQTQIAQPILYSRRISRRTQRRVQSAFNVLQKKCAACDKEEKELQPKLNSIQRSGKGNFVSDSIESKLNNSKGQGQQMDSGTKAIMETSFGADFSAVRIHTDNKAVQMSKDLGAHAFAVGNDVYFNEAKYQPQSKEGLGLLSHELTHVVQQGGSVQTKRNSDIPGAGIFSNPVLNQNIRNGALHQSSLFRDAISRFQNSTPKETILKKQQMMQSKTVDKVQMADTSRNLRRCVSGCNGGGSNPSPPPAAPCVPSLTSLTATKTGSVAMTTAWSGNCEIAFGTPSAVGITIDTEVNVPSDCSGKLEFVQLVETCRQKTVGGSNQKLKSSGFVLDTQDPYGGKSKTVSSPGSATFSMNDSPGNGVAGTTNVKINDSFKTWLLWTPTGSPRVALGSVTWNWSADVSSNGNPGCATGWTVNSQSASGGTGSATSTLPTWSGNVTGLTWVPGSC